MKALLTATLVLSTLLFGAHDATALPTSDPPGLGTPAAPPEPRPCAAGPVPCDTVAPATLRTAPVNATNWWRVAVPVLALIALAASGAFLLLIQRTERRPQRPSHRPQ